MLNSRHFRLYLLYNYSFFNVSLKKNRVNVANVSELAMRCYGIRVSEKNPLAMLSSLFLTVV